MKTFLQIALLALLTLILNSCASSGKSISPYNLSESDYSDIIEPYTKTIQKYNGMQNVLELHVTIINSKVIDAQLNRQATVLAWNDIQFSEGKNKRFENQGNETQVFVSFFTPDNKNGDLARSSTLWKVFLDSDGRRFEGKAERMPGLAAEINLLYPEHTRFATPYLIKFPVALSTVENYPSKVIVTGPLGQVEVEFPAKN